MTMAVMAGRLIIWHLVTKFEIRAILWFWIESNYTVVARVASGT